MALLNRLERIQHFEIGILTPAQVSIASHQPKQWRQKANAYTQKLAEKLGVFAHHISQLLVHNLCVESNVKYFYIKNITLPRIFFLNEWSMLISKKLIHPFTPLFSGVFENANSILFQIKNYFTFPRCRDRPDVVPLNITRTT
jgi:hypothetical protein